MEKSDLVVDLCDMLKFVCIYPIIVFWWIAFCLRTTFILNIKQVNFIKLDWLFIIFILLLVIIAIVIILHFFILFSSETAKIFFVELYFIFLQAVLSFVFFLVVFIFTAIIFHVILFQRLVLI